MEREFQELIRNLKVRKIGQTYYAVPIKATPLSLIQLNETGLIILKIFKGNMSLEQTIADISEIFGIPKNTAKKDVTNFMQQIKSVRTESLKNTKVKRFSKTNLRGTPIKGSVELTGRCNLLCLHCYATSERQKEALDTQTLKKLLTQMANAGVMFLQITGGECTSRRDFIEIYKHVRKLGIIPTISTNATLLNNIILTTLKDYPPFNILVSLYGSTPEIHDRITGIKGSFNKMVGNVQKLKDLGLNVCFNSILLKENFTDAKNIKSFASSMGIPVFFYDMLIPTLTANADPWKHQSETKKNVVNDPLPDYMTWDLKRNLTTNSSDFYGCNAGTETFHIDCSGNISPCKIYREQSFSCVKLGFGKAWDKLRDSPKSFLKTHAECHACGIKTKCTICPAKKLLASMAGKPNHFCNFNDLYLVSTSKGGKYENFNKNQIEIC